MEFTVDASSGEITGVGVLVYLNCAHNLYNIGHLVEQWQLKDPIEIKRSFLSIRIKTYADPQRPPVNGTQRG